MQSFKLQINHMFSMKNHQSSLSFIIINIKYFIHFSIFLKGNIYAKISFLDFFKNNFLMVDSFILQIYQFLRVKKTLNKVDIIHNITISLLVFRIKKIKVFDLLNMEH